MDIVTSPHIKIFIPFQELEVRHVYLSSPAHQVSDGFPMCLRLATHSASLCSQEPSRVGQAKLGRGGVLPGNTWCIWAEVRCDPG